ncbi:MAG: class I adenylate-forming enzyme family protein [Acidimicrobiales bacterium]
MSAPPDPIAAYAAAAPDRVAIIEGDTATTYASLNAEVNRLANTLRSRGAQSGERLIWCSPNAREVLVTMHACRKLGLAAVPLSYRLTAGELEFLIEDSQATVVVAGPAQAAALAGVRDRLARVRTFVDMAEWDAVLAEGSPEEPPLPDPGGLGTAMMYTSGTTGRPKGAVRSRTDRAVLAAMLGALNFGTAEGLRDPNAVEVHLTSGPLYHAGPNAFALITHLLGGTVVVLRQFDPTVWLDLVTRHHVTSTFCTPTHLKRIVSLGADVVAAADLSSMRTLIANAAPVPYALKQDVVAKLGNGFLYEVYGSTELGIATVLGPADQLRKPGSCGRPYGGIELKVVGADGEEVPPGEEGELFIRTALAIDGYHGDVPPLAELADPEWKSVGDMARIDDEGYVYICDRKVDMVITGGVNVYPAEVEAVLHGHPDVYDAAVIGVPDDEWGERVHAVVQPWPGQSVDVAEIETHARARLAGYKVPRSWEVRPELPRTESGKLVKRLLTE